MFRGRFEVFIALCASLYSLVVVSVLPEIEIYKKGQIQIVSCRIIHDYVAAVRRIEIKQFHSFGE